MAEEIVTMQDGRKIIAMVSRLPDDSHCTAGDCRNPTSNTLRDLPVCRSCFDEALKRNERLRALLREAIDCVDRPATRRRLRDRLGDILEIP